MQPNGEEGFSRPNASDVNATPLQKAGKRQQVLPHFQHLHAIKLGMWVDRSRPCVTQYPQAWDPSLLGGSWVAISRVIGPLI